MKVRAYIHKNSLTALFVGESVGVPFLPPEIEKLKLNTEEKLIELDENIIGMNREDAIAAINEQGYYVNEAKIDWQEIP